MNRQGAYEYADWINDNDYYLQESKMFIQVNKNALKNKSLSDKQRKDIAKEIKKDERYVKSLSQNINKRVSELEDSGYDIYINSIIDNDFRELSEAPITSIRNEYGYKKAKTKKGTTIIKTRDITKEKWW